MSNAVAVADQVVAVAVADQVVANANQTVANANQTVANANQVVAVANQTAVIHVFVDEVVRDSANLNKTLCVLFAYACIINLFQVIIILLSLKTLLPHVLSNNDVKVQMYSFGVLTAIMVAISCLNFAVRLLWLGSKYVYRQTADMVKAVL